VHRKAIKRGFDFTLMVVGEAGMGKSTLVSSLFLKDLYNDRQIRSVEEKVNRTVEIEKHYLEIEEKGVKLRLTIVDTPGFNDSLNGHESWKPITEYIEKQFDQYFKDESGLNRRNIKDNRVHCCLYFVSPLGHGLRQIDIQFMKRLHGLVNIVPVIAKADTLTPVELAKLKNRVLEEVEKHHIRIYEFPECDSDEDEEFQDMDKQLKASVPFAVIGSNHIADVNGKKVRARLYPWGIVEVDNNVHCDFGKLRQMLISTHMQDLKDITRDIHYENFRAKYIKEQMTKQQKERTSDFTSPESIVAALSARDKNSKLKRDSMHGGDTEADKLLQQKDAELEKMRMMLSKMQEQLKGSGQVNGLGNL